MVMPRFSSSLWREAQTPVSAWTRVVLPWSTWPMVPMLISGWLGGLGMSFLPLYGIVVVGYGLIYVYESSVQTLVRKVTIGL